MTYFFRSGNRFSVSPTANVDMSKELPVGTYTVGFDQMANQFFLEQVADLTVPAKIYGDTTKQADRILGTFLSRTKSTGVMLTGEKGSGKTMLATKLSVDARNVHSIPTIVINNPWAGEEFNRFLQMIEQPTVIIFDEFEKVYDREQQERMLTLLDGVYPSKKLFVLTCNDKYRVDKQMLNRPGRIFYRIEYTGLSAEFIREYCEDNLKNDLHAKYTETLCKIASVFGEFNFDILKAIVEEMNRYGESPQDAMNILNAKPENSEAKLFEASLTRNGAPVTLDRDQWMGNPLQGAISVYAKLDFASLSKKKLAELVDNGDDFSEIHFTTNHLVLVDPNAGRFEFENDKHERLTLTKKVTVSTYNLDAL